MTEPVIEAVVQVGAVETRYLRCGRGMRVLIVLAESDDERSWIMSKFRAEYCVIAPVPAQSVEAQQLQQWLRGVIEGLGLERPLLVLAPGLMAEAERIVADCGDSVELVFSLAHSGG